MLAQDLSGHERMNRRGFLASLAAIATAPLAFLLPTRAIALPTPTDGLKAVIADTGAYGTVGGISRATCSFWRNQQPPHPHNIQAMNDAMEKITFGPHADSPIRLGVLTNIE